MKIAVIDGQGGGLGKTIIDKLRKELPADTEILALGTNAYAATNMVKSGANEGASGTEAICYCCGRPDIDCIVGPIGIICANSMMGELSPKVAECIFKASCTKYLLPVNKHGLYIPCVKDLSINELLSDIINEIKNTSKKCLTHE